MAAKEENEPLLDGSTGEKPKEAADGSTGEKPEEAASTTEAGNLGSSTSSSRATGSILGDDIALNAHMGPIPLPGGQGTLTAADKRIITERTQCSAAVRFRSQWSERALTVTGPPNKLEEAVKLARQLIKNNGVEGGRKSHDDGGTGKSSGRSKGWPNSWKQKGRGKGEERADWPAADWQQHSWSNQCWWDGHMWMPVPAHMLQQTQPQQYQHQVQLQQQQQHQQQWQRFQQQYQQEYQQQY